METNSIYVTKKEFYSVTTGILGYLFLTVWVSEELGWSQYVLGFFLLATLVFYSHKLRKETRKRASSKTAEN